MAQQRFYVEQLKTNLQQEHLYDQQPRERKKVERLIMMEMDRNKVTYAILYCKKDAECYSY